TPFDQSDYLLSDTNNNMTTSRPTTPFSPFDGISPPRDKNNSKKYSFPTNQEQVSSAERMDDTDKKFDNNSRTIPFPVLLCSANGNSVLGVVEPSLLRKCFLLGMSVSSSTALTANSSPLPPTTITTNIVNNKQEDNNNSLSTTILSKYPNSNENNTNYSDRYSQPYNSAYHSSPITKNLLSMKTTTTVQSDGECNINILSGVNNAPSVPSTDKIVRSRKPKKRTNNGPKSKKTTTATTTQPSTDEMIIENQDHEENRQQDLVTTIGNDDQQRIHLYQLLCDILQQPEISRLLRDYSESSTNNGDLSSTPTATIPPQLMAIVSFANALYNNDTSQLTSAMKIDGGGIETIQEVKEDEYETVVPSPNIQLPDDQIQQDIQDLRMLSHGEATTQDQENDIQLSEHEMLLSSLNELTQNIDDESLTRLLSVIDPNILAAILSTASQEQTMTATTVAKNDEQQQDNQQDEIQQIILELFRKQKLCNLVTAAGCLKNDEQTTNETQESEQNQQQEHDSYSNTSIQLISNSLVLSSDTPLLEDKDTTTSCFDSKLNPLEIVKNENENKQLFNDKKQIKRPVSSQQEKKLKRKMFSSAPSSPVFIQQPFGSTELISRIELSLKNSKTTVNDDGRNSTDDSVDKEVENYMFGNIGKRKTDLTEEENSVKRLRSDSIDENEQQQQISPPLLLPTIIEHEILEPEM
ncbi:unnamed protein product, partial [Didymodactylos carnosus]